MRSYGAIMALAGPCERTADDNQWSSCLLSSRPTNKSDYDIG